MSDDPRYHRLLVATREAAQRGYDAVQMRDLASSAHMSLQTIYQFCSSKDHLIAEAHVDWIGTFRDDLLRRPPKGDTAAERVVTVLRRIARSLDRNPELTATILRALYSPEPAVQRSRRVVSATYDSIIDAAIGDEKVVDRPAAIEVLGLVLNSVMAQWVTESITASEAGDILERAVRLVVRAP